MGFEATNSVFWVSDKARLKPVSSATETSKKTEISLVEAFQKANSKGADQSGRMHRLVCTFVVRKPQRQVFSHQGPHNASREGSSLTIMILQFKQEIF